MSSRSNGVMKVLLIITRISWVSSSPRCSQFLIARASSARCGASGADEVGEAVGGGRDVIRVGAATETELKEKKARVEDAMHATRAAVEEGIVPGGGVALVRAAKALDKFRANEEGEGDADEQIGVTIVRRALEEPLRQIVQNAGKEGAVIVEKVREAKKESYGYNAATENFEDLVEAGVIDPAKVTRSALQNAASIAGLMLTTEALISELPEDDKAPAMPGGMGGGMGM